MMATHYYIDPELCADCGACYAMCPNDAIVRRLYDLQPCGHPVSAITKNPYGSQWCTECAKEAHETTSAPVSVEDILSDIPSEWDVRIHRYRLTSGQLRWCCEIETDQDKSIMVHPRVPEETVWRRGDDLIETLTEVKELAFAIKSLKEFLGETNTG
jgi:hypothetical protein